MPTQHVVVQGECLSSIAHDFGFSSFRALYDDPLNETLKQKRPNPNVIFPGDVVMIPDKKPELFSGSTGARHRFVVKKPETLRLRVRTLGADGDPVAQRPFKLDVGGQSSSGTTDGDGLVDQPVPHGVKSGTLTIQVDDADPPTEITFQLQLGALDPIDEVSGLQGRLRNFGIDTGPIDGDFGDLTRAAMQTFQRRFGLTVTDEPDDATRQALLAAHEGPGPAPKPVAVAAGGESDAPDDGSGAGDPNADPTPVLGEDDEALDGETRQ